ncbi:response regulator [Anaerolineales bacterium HSG6]|nr:response regulator [Anaerolineales bacterium HSG6]MDM8531445.1 response regulator [Anaerolineales bacterium HSG25]
MVTNIKVLVIDDIAHIRRLVTRMLEQAGFTVIEAANGLEGLKRVEEQSPDIITCDVSMPVMDGHEFLREVKRNSKTQQIPVIIITAIGEQVKKSSNTHQRADAYLTKPFSANRLIEVINKLLSAKVSSESAS